MSINKVAPLLLSAFSALKRAKVSRSTRIQAPPSPQPQPQPAQKCAGRQESRGKSRRRGGKSVVAHDNYTHASALTRELNSWLRGTGSVGDGAGEEASKQETWLGTDLATAWAISSGGSTCSTHAAQACSPSCSACSTSMQHMRHSPHSALRAPRGAEPNRECHAPRVTVTQSRAARERPGAWWWGPQAGVKRASAFAG